MLPARSIWCGLALCVLHLRVDAQDAPPVIVRGTASRDAAGEESGLARVTVSRMELADAPSSRLDEILRASSPGFGLFRRTDSHLANPTAQGVSLRNIGPSGAGRSLVLLDGIPQNDPFGGWVYWSRLPSAAIESVEITPGGGAGAWGNAALSGTIELSSRVPASNGLRFETTIGNGRALELGGDGERFFDLGEGRSLALFGRGSHFSSDGFPVVRADRRGPIDVAAWSEADLLEAGIRLGLARDSALTLKLTGFRERRGNGTPLTENSTRALDASATLDGLLAARDASYRVQFYAQWREFRSFFTSVNDTRTAEVPSLDQFNVPAHALGGSLLVRLAPSVGHRLVAGFDLREVEGETRERFRFLNGQFTRLRAAGGTQRFLGLFAEDAWTPAPGTIVTGALRFDAYASDAGHRRESRLTDGAVLLDQHFHAQRGVVANARLGGTHDFTADPGQLRLRGALYSGFRVPTLNELYRPFRVRNDITEANPDLQPERIYGAEAGLDIRPIRALRITLTGFFNELLHPVTNVTLVRGPATAALFGVIPAGGVGRQRRNLGRADIPGVQAALEWQASPVLTFSAAHLYSRGVITSAPEARALEGRRFAQAPEHQFVVSARWRSAGGWHALLQLRVTGPQFEDDQNSLRLAAAVTAEASVGYRFSPVWDVRASIGNAFNQRVETGRTADGLVSIGAPRTFSIGLRGGF